MRDVAPYSIPDDSCLRFVPAYPCHQSVEFKANECSDRHVDVVQNGFSFPNVSFLNAAALLDPSVVLLDSPSLTREFVSLFLIHPKVIGSPVFNAVSFFGDCPEHFDHSESLEVNYYTSIWRYLYVLDWLVSIYSARWIDQSILL